MAAPSAPTAPRFSPVERPRTAIATDGTLAAIIETQRVVVLELPGGEPFAEVGVDRAALANEVAWVGAPPRLLVLSRYAEHSRVHLVDPHGPRALADLKIETPMRLAATCGAHALVVSPQSALIITAADNLLVSVPYPARAVPAHAGAAGPNFLVAHADSVEEWDPQARMPKRRLKLPRAATITALGGSDRVVWMTTQQEPARLDVLALVDRGQPKKHDLPEPIAYATGHPRSDLVVCIGESGKVYVVDLDGRSKLRTLAIDGIDKVDAAGLVVGRIVGVLAAQAERPVAIHTLEGPLPEVDAPIAPASSASSGRTASPAANTGRTASPTNAPTSGAASSPGSSSGAQRSSGSVATVMPQAPSTSGSEAPAPRLAAATDAPVERKKPPPPPPGRSGNTVPPPMGGASHASVPPAPSSAPSSAPASGSHAAISSTKTPGPVPSMPALTLSADVSAATRATPSAPSSGPTQSTPISPSASSLARPATRAFARAPTPHPRASSEGVDVDLDGVFDELSSEGTAYEAPASTQFDSPLALEARSVADHPAPTDGTARDMKPTEDKKPDKKPAKLTDPRPVPPANDRTPAATPVPPKAAAVMPVDSVATNETSATNESKEWIDSIDSIASDRSAAGATAPRGSRDPDRSAALDPDVLDLDESRPVEKAMADDDDDVAPPLATASAGAAGGDVGIDAKLDAKLDSKLDSKLDAKLDAKFDAKIDAKIDARTDDSRNASKGARAEDSREVGSGYARDAHTDDSRSARTRGSLDAAESRDARAVAAGDMHSDGRADVRGEAHGLRNDPSPARVSGPTRAPRESQPSLRDAPARRPVRREVTVRQGAALPAPRPAWRDEIVYWTYEVFDGVVQRGAPIASPLDDLAQRFDVTESILPALVVLYGAHLAGERGVAPVHVARVLGSWDEALGRGLLASRGLATFAESRVRLAGPIQRFLDEVAVETGALVGVPGTVALPGPHVVIAAAETPLKVVAVRWLGQVGGAILAAHDDADLAEMFVEARARGAAPMFRIGADELLELGTDPAILVVTDEEVAESLGVPRLG